MTHTEPPIAVALRKHIAGDARFDNPTRAIYSTDGSNYRVLPLGVVLPKTHEDIAATVQLCAEHGVPVVPRGGGSGLAGQAIGAGIVIDTTRYMDALLDLDIASRQVRVQTGMILGQLNKQLGAHGLLFGPDPASAERAAIGGVIGTNATGSHSIRHGMTADNVTALRCVRADGATQTFERGAQSPLQDAVLELVAQHREAIYSAYPKVWRRASGYTLDYIAEMLAFDPAHPHACLTDAHARRQTSNREAHLRQISALNLAPLIVGSEGTLAVVSEAVLQLAPKPKHTALVIVSFQSLLESMRAIPALLTLNPGAIELIGGLFIKLARELPECRERLGWLDAAEGIPDGLLVMEFDADSAADVEDGIARLQALVTRERLPCTLRPLRDAKLQADVWYVRKIGLNVLASIRSDFKPISVIEDIAVPVERLPEFVECLNAIFHAHNTEGAYYAHASAGVLHVRPLINLKTMDGLRAMQAIARETFALCHDLGGAMSGEHGDGYERSQWNRALFGEEIYGAFKQLKHLFDPNNLLNPNKKVDALDEAQLEPLLRLGPGYAAQPFTSVFSYSVDGSLAGMAEQCNGSGVCRKLDSGVMCPSFRATREEMHSTRGRANLLREFLRAGDSAPAVSGDGVAAALDLCLSCKACESECASGVDMAKMKSDFMQQRYDVRGVPLRAWLFGRIAQLSALAAPVAPLANWLLGRALFKRALGIAPQRALPRFAGRAAARQLRVSPAKDDANAPVVALFLDTFTRHNSPEIGAAAIAVLERAGYRVLIPAWRCCGRPSISQGQPRAALDAARYNLSVLAPLAQAGIPILGLEPSCVSALKDDYRELLPGDQRAEAVAAATRTIDDFLAESAAFQNLMRALFADGQGAVRPKALLHGHCHQKALWGTTGSKRMLALAGYDVREIESTCCGMAGAFGYEAEHAALSSSIAELDLLPAVRAAPADAQLCAPGTSCREQIAGLSARTAAHPIELVWERLQKAGAARVV